MAENKTVIQWYPGHMAKAKRNMIEDFALVDIVVEVLDARIPFSSRNPDLAALTHKKPQLLLLNKKDLAEQSATDKWLQYYRNAGYLCIAVNAAEKQGVNAMLNEIKHAAEPVMLALERKGRLRRPIRAMIVGIPNTGKSTVINSFSPQKSAITGNKPGVTKGRQWIKTAAGIEMLDTPGVLWPKFASMETALRLAACGSISDLVSPLPQIAAFLGSYLMANGEKGLKERFKLEELPADADALFEAIGRKRGLIAQGGVIKLEQAQGLLINEFRSGKLGRYTLDNYERLVSANEQGGKGKSQGPAEEH